MWILLFIVRKSPSSLPLLQLIPRSNSGKISVPLAVHNSPLLLYLCTSKTLLPWIIIFLTLYLLRLIPLALLLALFPSLLTFPRPSILFQSLLIFTIFLNPWLPLDLLISLVACSYYAFLNVLIPFSILNFSFSHNTFPSSRKHSIVLPILKTNNPSSPSSFRPILLPPFFSKLLEYICFSQLNAFVSNFNILPSCQSGFHRSHSTTELLHISDIVLRNFDNCHLTFIIALNFTKVRQLWSTFS